MEYRYLFKIKTKRKLFNSVSMQFLLFRPGAPKSSLSLAPLSINPAVVRVPFMICDV